MIRCFMTLRLQGWHLPGNAGEVRNVAVALVVTNAAPGPERGCEIARGRAGAEHEIQHGRRSSEHGIDQEAGGIGEGGPVEGVECRGAQLVGIFFGKLECAADG